MAFAYRVEVVGEYEALEVLDVEPRDGFVLPQLLQAHHLLVHGILVREAQLAVQSLVLRGDHLRCGHGRDETIIAGRGQAAPGNRSC